MALELDNVAVFKGDTRITGPVSLRIEPGDVATIMGPSGCGKSTLLSAVTGSLDPVFRMTGDIRLSGSTLLDKDMADRNIGILFQDDLLFPHMTVASNLAFALPGRMPGPEKRRQVATALETAGLSGFETRDPATLSGGQKARVSLLRTLLAKPSAILLDEPFARLDRALKAKIRAFVFSRIKTMNIPSLLVTHDPGDCPEQGRIIELAMPQAGGPDV